MVAFAYVFYLAWSRSWTKAELDIEESEVSNQPALGLEIDLDYGAITIYRNQMIDTIGWLSGSDHYSRFMLSFIQTCDTFNNNTKVHGEVVEPFFSEAVMNMTTELASLLPLAGPVTTYPATVVVPCCSGDKYRELVEQAVETSEIRLVTVPRVAICQDYLARFMVNGTIQTGDENYCAVVANHGSLATMFWLICVDEVVEPARSELVVHESNSLAQEETQVAIRNALRRIAEPIDGMRWFDEMYMNDGNPKIPRKLFLRGYNAGDPKFRSILESILGLDIVSMAYEEIDSKEKDWHLFSGSIGAS